MTEGDAIIWTFEAPSLLPLVDRALILDNTRSYRNTVESWRSFDQHDEGNWPCYVDFGQRVGGGIESIRTSGEIAPHVDEGFPPYTTLLLVRPNGYNVTGVVDNRQADNQPPGMMIHFHAHRYHGLIRPDTDWKWFTEADFIEYAKPLPMGWFALTWDTDVPQTKTAAYKHFRQQLLARQEERRAVAAA